jgi:hypothetical protein
VWSLSECRNPRQLVPLLGDQSVVHGAVEQRLKRTTLGLLVELIELLIGQVLQPRHEGDAEQVAQSEELFGKAVGVGRVDLRAQQGVVLKQPVEHEASLPRCAGDDLGGEHAELVGDVRVERDRLVVIAEVARIDGPQQATPLHSEALAIGRGERAVAPDAAERQSVMVIDDRLASCLQRCLAQEPLRSVLELVRRHALDAAAHGGDAEIGEVDPENETAG